MPGACITCSSAIDGVSDYRGKANGYRIGYASSVDLIHWCAMTRKAGIDVSETGWDAEMISYPHVFEVDGTTYLAYLGDQVGRYGFGLAVLDGSLDRAPRMTVEEAGQGLRPDDGRPPGRLPGVRAGATGSGLRRLRPGLSSPRDPLTPAASTGATSRSSIWTDHFER